MFWTSGWKHNFITVNIVNNSIPSYCGHAEKVYQWIGCGLAKNPKIHFCLWHCYLENKVELLSLTEHMGSPLVFFWGSCCSIFSFVCTVLWIFVCPVVLLFWLMSVSFRFTASDHRFNIFKMVLLSLSFMPNSK